MKKYILFLITIFITIITRIIIIEKHEPYIFESKYIYGLTAPRGRILDRNGIVLVDNVGVKSLMYNKLDIDTEEEKNIANEISSIIGYSQNEVLSLMNNGFSYENKIIKKKLTDEEYLLLNQSNLKGIFTEITWERYYPFGNTLKEVFGMVSSYEQGLPKELANYYLKKGYVLNDRVGINNLEYLYDEYLKGNKGKYRVDDQRLILEKEPKKGNDIILNIDITLQNEIESIMEEEMLIAKSKANTKYYKESYLIVSNPSNGEIISFIGKRINADLTFTDVSYNNIINSYAPGSIVKAASISVGYKYNLIPEGKIQDGCIKLLNQNERCSWSNLGYINETDALKWSSNYYQYLLAIKLTGQEYKKNMKLNATNSQLKVYRNMFLEYGLGAKTGIDLSNEATGYQGNFFDDDLYLSFVIGQYDNYTPAQLANYINTIGVGKRYALSLFNSAINASGETIYQKKAKILNELSINNNTINKIKEGLHAVNNGGTGNGYVSKKYDTAGKTGTSTMFIDTNQDGYIDAKTTTLTYGMFSPVENPTISIVLISPHISYETNNNYTYSINYHIMKKISSVIIEKYT